MIDEETESLREIQGQYLEARLSMLKRPRAHWKKYLRSQFGQMTERERHLMAMKVAEDALAAKLAGQPQLPEG